MCSTCPLFNFKLSIFLSQPHCVRVTVPFISCAILSWQSLQFVLFHLDERKKKYMTSSYSFIFASFRSSYRLFDIVVFDICFCSFHFASFSACMETPAHLHIYLNLFIKNEHRQATDNPHRQYGKLLTKTKRQSGMVNEHWCGWINWIIKSSIGKVNKYTQIILSNVYNVHFESNIIFHCTFSGPFSIPSLLIHTPNRRNRMRVGRWLTFYLRNKNYFVFCLNQCDALRRMIC